MTMTNNGMEFTAMNPVNWDIVLSNIAEAREELQQLEAGIEKRALEIEELQIGLQHAYHHLNFAWNSKHAPAERHANLTHKDFQTWSEYPSEMNPL